MPRRPRRGRVVRSSGSISAGAAMQTGRTAAAAHTAAVGVTQQSESGWSGCPCRSRSAGSWWSRNRRRRSTRAGRLRGRPGLPTPAARRAASSGPLPEWVMRLTGHHARVSANYRESGICAALSRPYSRGVPRRDASAPSWRASPTIRNLACMRLRRPMRGVLAAAVRGVARGVRLRPVRRGPVAAVHHRARARSRAPISSPPPPPPLPPSRSPRPARRPASCRAAWRAPAG